MKKQFFTFAFAVAMATNVIAFDERSMFDETNEASKWTYLENKFITQPAAQKAAIWAHIGSAAAGMVVLGSFSSLFALNEKQLEAKMFNEPFQTSNVLASTGTLSAAALLASYVECYLSARADRNAIESFFSNWEKNQFFVPAELEDAFDLIAQAIELEGQDAVLNNAHDIVEMIQFHVMRHFEKRYEKILQMTAYNSAKETKTVVDILKGSVETAGKLAGGK